MVDTQYLVDAVKDSGLKRQFIAEKLGCTRQSFSKKLITGEFDLKETNVLCEILGFSVRERDRIFFAKAVTESSDKTKKGNP